MSAMNIARPMYWPSLSLKNPEEVVPDQSDFSKL